MVTIITTAEQLMAIAMAIANARLYCIVVNGMSYVQIHRITNTMKKKKE